ncbi:MAG: hypothetical protein V1790_14435 [Planctomycetota bacterium]
MDEKSLLDEAVTAAGGNYRAGLEAAQRKCMAPFLSQGFSNEAARRRCEKEFPILFGRGRRPGMG